MRRASQRCLCAFCRSERTVYRKRHVSFFDVALTLLASGLLSLIVWQDLDPRLVMFFALGLGLAELFVVFRWRLTIACPKCGFDPVLYKTKPSLAAARVKEYYARKMLDPLSAFSPPPRLPSRSNSARANEVRSNEASQR
ncbi:MAG: hypothetical protein AAB250_14090 [Bdellovibrionota bacterium]|mgnify:FL=1